MRKKLLFVDDEEDWRLMVTNYLTEAGYEVLTAKDASEALTRTDGTKPDAMILDVNLAGENGMMLLSFLKRNHPDVPIILFTGLAHDDETILNMLQQGARQYVRKGSMGELIRAVESALKFRAGAAGLGAA
jgi:DNA-binding response OmpR family regulator